MPLYPKRNPCSLIGIISCRGCEIPEITGKLGNNISGIGIMSESELNLTRSFIPLFSPEKGDQPTRSMRK